MEPPRNPGRFNARRAGCFEMGDVAREKSGSVCQLVPEALAQAQVLLGVLGEIAHGVAPGQGWATVRKAARSTLA